MDGKMALNREMLFAELYKIMLNKVTFLGFRGEIAPISPPLDPCGQTLRAFFASTAQTNTLFFGGE